jgi:signal peptidase II
MLAILTGVVVVDQTSKVLVTAWLGEGSGSARVDLWGPVFALQYTRNSGAAFGLMSGHGLLLTIIAAIIVVVLVAVAGRTGQRLTWHTAALGLVAGGAVGNVMDRLWLGHVVDFIDVGRWPTFNLADAAITAGIGLFIVVGFRQSSQEERDRTEGQRDSESVG